ncbi:MAG: hypothetical protein WEC14_07515 [Chloroflexota bacterium]
MAEETPTGGATDSEICPWCSATYVGAPERCPSCGATLAGDAAVDPALPGLTAIDAAAIVRAKQPVAKPRNRLLSWISGDYPDQGNSPLEAAALAPPADEVRREILRLELEAEVARLTAESDALLSEAKVEGRAVPGPAPLPDAVEAAPDADADPETPTA